LSKLSKRIGLYVVLAFSLISVCAAQHPTANAQPKPNPPRALRVTAVHLAGVNIPQRAFCPVKINFSGTITTNGAAEVKYTWVSFDGGTWPEGTLHFAKAGTQKVSKQLEMGSSGQPLHGWLQLKVLSPNAVLSNKATYSVKCMPDPRHK
jgi:hypothetical protein